MDEQKQPGKAQKRRQEAAKRLREQGLKLIAQNGLSACKVEHITRAAGVGKGTFFTHFGGKDQFVAELVDQVLSDVARRVRPVVMAPTDAQAVLSGIGSVHLRYFQLRPDSASLLVQACSLDAQGPAGEQVRRRLNEHLEMLAGMLAPAAEAVGWPARRAPELALMILATSCGFFWFGNALGLGHDTPVDLMERLGRGLALGLAKV